MKHRGGRILIALGNTATGALMAYGGVEEVMAYWPAEWSPVSVGALGALTGSTLAASGLALLTGVRAARPLALTGSLSSLAVHTVGVALGYIGALGLILGVAYPAVAFVYAYRLPPAQGAAMGEQPSARAGEDRGTTGLPLVASRV